ncbi:hypothetical protein [Bradyrhizobium sp. BR 1433]|uniref:hypothetical protein n=1 Tax=Bradyrhizobium sp. BR 1433 TaxID=3447967 RepID=UPI003EE475C5
MAVMKCNQCDRPAIYRVGDADVPLCLDCWNKFQSANYMQFLINAASANQALDDMDFISGFHTSGGRIPVAELARAIVKGPVHNSFNINNSSVGVINTGDLARIQAVVDFTKTTDIETLGEGIRNLTQAVVDAKDIAAQDKRAIIELIEAFGEQAVRTKKPSAMALLKAIEARAKGIASIYGAAETLIKIAHSIFGV